MMLATPLAKDAPGCLYTGTAVPPDPYPRLESDLRADVAVVGAGYTGLSTALHAALGARRVVVLEAHEPGWGAAGRNGGQVNAGLKHEPDEVERDLGATYGPRLVSLSSRAPDVLFELIARFSIECEARRAGTLRAAYQPSHAAAVRASTEQWQRRGVGVEWWDAARVASAIGTSRYLGAAFDPRGGSVNPLSLARGLARAARAAGATIHGDSPALQIVRDGHDWRIATPAGSVLAKQVVIATDGYSGKLWPGLRTSIVPIFSSIAATEPLPPELRALILPRGEVLYESGDITVYYRVDEGGRLLMGGRGGQHRSSVRADYGHLIRYARRLWPALGNVQWMNWWNGQFALTPDFYPRIHAPAPNLLIALGYSGRGVAMGTALGAEIARAVAGDPLESLPIPVTDVPRVPFHAFWRIGVSARVAYGRLLDRFGR
jgi:glycine/D-amino acid oxidase-like deaminating enzyme